jgi:hypothetical protein
MIGETNLDHLMMLDVMIEVENRLNLLSDVGCEFWK